MLLERCPTRAHGLFAIGGVLGALNCPTRVLSDFPAARHRRTEFVVNGFGVEVCRTQFAFVCRGCGNRSACRFRRRYVAVRAMLVLHRAVVPALIIALP